MKQKQGDMIEMGAFRTLLLMSHFEKKIVKWVFVNVITAVVHEKHVNVPKMSTQPQSNGKFYDSRSTKVRRGELQQQIYSVTQKVLQVLKTIYKEIRLTITIEIIKQITVQVYNRKYCAAPETSMSDS